MAETPLLLAAAPNGARRGKADHPDLPITPEEIAAEAKACMEAGAQLLHLHVRDEAGGHSLDPARYEAAIAAVRAATVNDLVIQVTTEAAGIYGPEDQMAVIRKLRPEAASFALRELIPESEAEPRASEFFAWAADQGIAAQFILYNSEEVARFLDLVRRTVLPAGPHHALFVLGGRDRDADPKELSGFLREWPRDWPWSVCAFGAAERDVAALAIGLDGHGRVGFENNLVDPDGNRLESTAAQVAAVREIAGEMGRPLADIGEARKRLGLSGGPR